MSRRQIAVKSTFRLGDAFFICDVCSQRFRRSQMLTRWDNLKVDARCDDPRPPQMTPPNLYPEGMPFPDARPPNDRPDILQDESYMRPITGGVEITNGVRPVYPSGQVSPPGAKAPQDVLQTPLPAPSVNLVEEDRAIRTGPVAAPTAPGAG